MHLKTLTEVGKRMVIQNIMQSVQTKEIEGKGRSRNEGV